MDTKQRLTDLADAGLKALQPNSTAMVDPLFAHTVAKEALEDIRARDSKLAAISARLSAGPSYHLAEDLQKILQS